MAWTDTTRKAESNGSAVASLNVTHNSAASGSLIVVGTSMWKSTGAPTACAVSDGTNGAYTNAFTPPTLNGTACSLDYFANSGAANLTITSNPSGGGSGDSNDMWVGSHEFSGGATASPISGTPGTATGTSSPRTSGSTTPGDDDCLVVAVLDYDNGSGQTENAGAEGYTLSNENHGTTDGGQSGSMVFKILTGGNGVAQSHTWTLVGGAADCTAGIAAFKPTAGAAAALSIVPLIQNYRNMGLMQ